MFAVMLPHVGQDRLAGMDPDGHRLMFAVTLPHVVHVHVAGTDHMERD